MRVEYDAKTVFGGILAEGVDHVIKGFQNIDRWYAAADTATSGQNGRDWSKLEGAPFGAAVGKGQDLWNALVSMRALLQDGGVENFIAPLDNGG